MYALIVVVAALVVYVMWPSIRARGARAAAREDAQRDKLATQQQSQLAVINNAPDSYFEKAGEMMLNLSIPGEGLSNGVYYAQGSNFQLSLNPPLPVP